MTSAGPCGGPGALQSLAQWEPFTSLVHPSPGAVGKAVKNEWLCLLVLVHGRRKPVCVEIWRGFLDL